MLLRSGERHRDHAKLAHDRLGLCADGQGKLFRAGPVGGVAVHGGDVLHDGRLGGVAGRDLRRRGGVQLLRTGGAQKTEAEKNNFEEHI